MLHIICIKSSRLNLPSHGFNVILPSHGWHVLWPFPFLISSSPNGLTILFVNYLLSLFLCCLWTKNPTKNAGYWEQILWSSFFSNSQYLLPILMILSALWSVCCLDICRLIETTGFLRYWWSYSYLWAVVLFLHTNRITNHSGQLLRPPPMLVIQTLWDQYFVLSRSPW